MKILMVCLGNICRSPIAEGILKNKIHKMGLDWYVDSAGTSGYHIGEMPDIRSIEIAERNGITIKNQRARMVRASDFETFDYIYAMDTSNYDDLMRMAPAGKNSKIKLILNEIDPNKNRDVPDPYYGGPDGFRNVFDQLDKACDCMIQKLISVYE